MNTLILDGVTAVPTMGNTNAFTSTLIASGTGYVYVPRSLISAFQANSRWGSYQLRTIEDYPELLA